MSHLARRLNCTSQQLISPTNLIFSIGKGEGEVGGGGTAVTVRVIGATDLQPPGFALDAIVRTTFPMHLPPLHMCFLSQLSHSIADRMLAVQNAVSFARPRPLPSSAPAHPLAHAGVFLQPARHPAASVSVTDKPYPPSVACVCTACSVVGCPHCRWHGLFLALLLL